MPATDPGGALGGQQPGQSDAVRRPGGAADLGARALVEGVPAHALPVQDQLHLGGTRPGPVVQQRGAVQFAGRHAAAHPRQHHPPAAVHAVEAAPRVRAAPGPPDHLDQRFAGGGQQPLLLERGELHLLGDLRAGPVPHVQRRQPDRAPPDRLRPQELPGVALDPRVLDPVVVVVVAGDDLDPGHAGDLQHPLVGVRHLLDQSLGDPAGQRRRVPGLGELPPPAQQAAVGDAVDGDVPVPGEPHQRVHHQAQPVQRPGRGPAEVRSADDVGELDQIVRPVRGRGEVAVDTVLHRASACSSGTGRPGRPSPRPVTPDPSSPIPLRSGSGPRSGLRRSPAGATSASPPGRPRRRGPRTPRCRARPPRRASRVR